MSDSNQHPVGYRPSGPSAKGPSPDPPSERPSRRSRRPRRSRRSGRRRSPLRIGCFVLESVIALGAVYLFVGQPELVADLKAELETFLRGDDSGPIVALERDPAAEALPIDPEAERERIGRVIDAALEAGEADRAMTLAVESHPGKLRELLDDGADPNQRLTSGVSEGSYSVPLVRAIERGTPATVEVLLEAGADVDRRDSSGTTPLVAAARRGDAELVRRLIALGARPARIAISDRELEVEQRMRRDGVEKPPAMGTTPLEAAASAGHLEIVEILLGEGTPFRTALIRAASEGHLEVVRRLVEAGADPLEVDNGFTAIDHARAGGHDEIVELLEAGSRRRLEME